MKIEEAFKKLKPVSNMDMDRLWREYILADMAGRRAIEDSLRIALAQRLDETFEERDVLLEPPPDGKAEGEYPLGIVAYGKDRFGWFGLREREWIQHVGIFGRSGSGKTNVNFLVVLNLLARGKPFLIFDWKRNYRDLLPLFPDREILVFTVGRPVSPFYFNPLIPPKGVPPAIWLKKLIEIVCHAFFLGEGVSFLFQQAIDSVYREYGVYSGNNRSWPTFHDVKEWMQRSKVKGREAQWMDSAMRAVGVLCFGEVSRVLNRREPLDIAGLLERNAILELDALTNSDKTFFIEALLLWIHHFRLSQPDREVFKHAILVEEAHHILLRKKQEVYGEEAVTDIILREIRELGEAVVLIDQHPSLISKPALGNTYTTVAMNLKHRSDIAMIADSILLDTKHARYLGKLEVGTAMVKLQGRWFEPFLVRFPLLKVRKGAVTDEDVRDRMEHAGFGPEGEEPAPATLSEPTQLPDSEQEGRGRVTDNERILLLDVHRHATSPVTERYERLGLNTYQGNRAKDSLIGKGLVRVSDIPTDKGRIKLLELTGGGKEALKGFGETASKSHRKGGPEHEYWKKKIAEEYRAQGWKVVDEYPIGGGKTVDLVCFRDGRKLAVEIETGKSYAAYNLKKCLDAGFDEVRSVSLAKYI
jgi:DNA-binding MarR family transcriptional regulator